MTIGRFTGIQVQNKVGNPSSLTFCRVNGVFHRSGTCFADTDVLFFTPTSDSDGANHLSVNDDGMPCTESRVFRRSLLQRARLPSRNKSVIAGRREPVQSSSRLIWPELASKTGDSIRIVLSFPTGLSFWCKELWTLFAPTPIAASRAGYIIQ